MPQALLVRGFILIFLCTPLTAQALTASQVFDKVKNSVVVIRTLNEKGEAFKQGSGVVLPSGKIATNCHVVKDGVSFQAGRGKNLVPASLYAGDEDKDICLLQADKLIGTPAQIGKAAALKVGAAVYAVGAPKGLELSLSDGIVSQLRGGPPPFIQTTAAISSGSSGGGLFDSEGRLVGFTTLYIDGGQSLNFAMPVEWLADLHWGKKTASKRRSQPDWLTRTLALQEKQDWSSLLDWGTQWAKAEPANFIAWFSIGLARQNMSRLDDAITAYREALRINPEFGDGWTNLGLAYHDLRRYDDAVTSSRQALRINPEDAVTWDNLGITFYNLKRYDDAIASYREAVRINPAFAAAWNNLGVANDEYKHYDNAITAFREAVRIDPDLAAAWSNLGLAYHHLNRYDDAIAAYRQSLRINPEDEDAWSNLGLTYHYLKRYNDAVTAYRESLRINPADTKAWNDLAVDSYLPGDTAAALHAVTALRTLDPAMAEKLFNLIVPR